MSDEDQFVRGNERIARLAARPDLAEGVARTRREMAEADRAHAMGLAAMRKAAERTQVEIAQKLGVSQARVSQIEQNQDMLLSTLNSYLEAIGGHATLVIHFEGGKDVELDLSSVARGS